MKILDTSESCQHIDSFSIDVKDIGAFAADEFRALSTKLHDWQNRESLHQLLQLQKELERHAPLADYFGGLRVPDLGRCDGEKFARIFLAEPEPPKKDAPAPRKKEKQLQLPETTHSQSQLQYSPLAVQKSARKAEPQLGKSYTPTHATPQAPKAVFTYSNCQIKGMKERREEAQAAHEETKPTAKPQPKTCAKKTNKENLARKEKELTISASFPAKID